MRFSLGAADRLQIYLVGVAYHGEVDLITTWRMLSTRLSKVSPSDAGPCPRSQREGIFFEYSAQKPAHRVERHRGGVGDVERADGARHIEPGQCSYRFARLLAQTLAFGTQHQGDPVA